MFFPFFRHHLSVLFVATRIVLVQVCAKSGPQCYSSLPKMMPHAPMLVKILPVSGCKEVYSVSIVFKLCSLNWTEAYTPISSDFFSTCRETQRGRLCWKSSLCPHQYSPPQRWRRLRLKSFGWAKKGMSPPERARCRWSSTRHSRWERQCSKKASYAPWNPWSSCCLWIQYSAGSAGAALILGDAPEPNGPSALYQSNFTKESEESWVKMFETLWAIRVTLFNSCWWRTVPSPQKKKYIYPFLKSFCDLSKTVLLREVFQPKSEFKYRHSIDIRNYSWFFACSTATQSWGMLKQSIMMYHEITMI